VPQCPAIQRLFGKPFSRMSTTKNRQICFLQDPTREDVCTWARDGRAAGGMGPAIRFEGKRLMKRSSRRGESLMLSLSPRIDIDDIGGLPGKRVRRKMPGREMIARR